MIHECVSSNDEEDDAQNRPRRTEHQESPRIRDAVVGVEVAEFELHVDRVTAKHVYSWVMRSDSTVTLTEWDTVVFRTVTICSHDDDGKDELQRS